MAFTDEEFESWHTEKLEAEKRKEVVRRPPPITECVICNRPFGIGEGIITEDYSICDLHDDD